MRSSPWHKQLRHAVIHLPPFGAAQATDVVFFLEKVIEAIWRAHGDAMADYHARVGIEIPKPMDAKSEWPKNDTDQIGF